MEPVDPDYMRLKDANRIIVQLRADLDLANARVVVLREGAQGVIDAMSWRKGHIKDDPNYWAGLRNGDKDGTNERTALTALTALLASPDDAAQQLLAVRDAAVAVTKEPGAMTACDCTDGPGWEYACPSCRLERAVAALATGPGTIAETTPQSPHDGADGPKGG